ncbi:MAG: undecaprenyl-diphosphate phosphatase [Candidatus Omnitrophica bacterium]|nr:undecaprenyl-diphosphate phosphatase [Candidatus Omnitrophota bacterium]
MNLWFAAIFGVVEGITEFLPISSTGHLILTAKLLGLEQSDFLTTFEIAIQLGAILAVIVLYWKRLFYNWKVLSRIAAAFIPTAILGLVFYKLVKKLMITGEPVVIAALFFGGLFMLLLEWKHKDREEDLDPIESMTYRQAFMIGIAQSLAMIPGVSRSAATICGGLLLGLKRRMIVEFSFLLAVPTMLAATTLDLLKNGSAFSGAQWDFLAIGFIVSFVVAMLSIRWLLGWIRVHTFKVFGFYRIIVAALFFFLR